MDNKVSEKAIWEGSIPSENENTQFSSFQQSQPQMMFCYKCNNVIPGNSKYCPCCKVELFTTCQKCGAKYSSQYHICNQCGTDRDEYLRLQKIERERKDAIERENQRQREIQERKRQEEEQRRKKEQEEKERQKFLKKAAEQADVYRQKETYLAENTKIAKTEEYSTVYSLMLEALEQFKNKYKRKNKRTIIIFAILSLLDIYALDNHLEEYLLPEGFMQTAVGTIIILFLGFGWLWCLSIVIGNSSSEKREKFVINYFENKDGYNKEFFNYVIEEMRTTNFDVSETKVLTKVCTIAYRKKYGLKIEEKWHSQL